MEAYGGKSLAAIPQVTTRSKLWPFITDDHRSPALPGCATYFGNGLHLQLHELTTWPGRTGADPTPSLFCPHLVVPAATYQHRDLNTAKKTNKKTKYEANRTEECDRRLLRRRVCGGALCFVRKRLQKTNTRAARSAGKCLWSCVYVDGLISSKTDLIGTNCRLICLCGTQMFCFMVQ